MGVSTRGRTHAFRLALCCGLALAAAPSREARAQGEQPLPARVVAEKIDEYGPIRHCDLTARLDNLAVELQNQPGARAYLVGYDPSQREGRHAESYVKRSSAYLVLSRGIDESRVVMRHGGRNNADEVKTELWLVLEGAHLPLDTKPLGEADEGKEFSGRLEKYATDDTLSGFEEEMGGPGSDDISQYNFARVLKRQPASQGYVVVYTAAGVMPGAWRRIARREEQSIRDRFELPEGRVRVVNGGTAAETRVELWVEPKDAPPPVQEALEELSLSAAFMLYEFGSTQWLTSEDEERLLLANLADLLRADERTRLNLIIHPPTPEEETEATEAEPARQTAEASATSVAAPSKVALAEVAAGAAPAAAEQPATTAPEDEDFQQKTRRWRDSIAKKYGVAPERVVVTVGRKNSWDSESLEVWVVPADAPMPDAFAPEPEPEPTPEDEEAEAPPEV